MTKFFKATSSYTGKYELRTCPRSLRGV